MINPILSKKLVASCFLASCLEIYDFVLFTFLTPLLQKNYFTFLAEETVLIVSYVLFGIGFVCRPLGSLIFGYVGDIFGRQKTLVLSVSLMGSCSLIMFLLPTYAMVGALACYIIVLVRVVQGISVGGEFTGALVFAIEHASSKQAGIVGGILSAGGAAGVLLATLVSNLLQHPSFPEYSWRLAFLLGFGLSIIGYIIRKRLTETPIFQSLKSTRKVIPLIEGFKTHKIECINTFLIAAANGTVFYFAVVFLPNFLKQTTGMDTKFLPVLITILVLFLAPLAGSISDRLGRWRLLFFSCMVMALYLPISLNLLISLSSLSLIILVLILYGAIFSVMTATINTFAVEIFPAQYRMSCSSFCYSVGMGVIGGTVPMISALIVKYFGSDPTFLGLYISSICLLAGISTLIVVKKNSRAVVT